MEWVDREHRCDERAAPEGAGQALEGEKEQQHGGRVKEQVRDQIAAGRVAAEFVVDRVRDRGERMPVMEVSRREGTVEPSRRETLFEKEVFRDVLRIIERNEIVVANRQEECRGSDPQSERQADTKAAVQRHAAQVSLEADRPSIGNAREAGLLAKTVECYFVRYFRAASWI
jgi:hypothetical protein